MLTAVATLGSTLIEIALLVALAEVTQASELVSTQVTTSLFCNDEVLNDELPPPTFTPFIFHW
jgi:hypothetical protein